MPSLSYPLTWNILLVTLSMWAGSEVAYSIDQDQSKLNAVPIGIGESDLRDDEAVDPAGPATDHQFHDPAPAEQNSLVNSESNSDRIAPHHSAPVESIPSIQSNAQSTTRKSTPKAPPAFAGPKNQPPTGPFRSMFFDNDFSAMGQTGASSVMGEELKLIPFDFLDTDLILSTGGEIRYRFMSQDNRLQPGGPGQDTYDLWRWRHYLDLKISDNFRLYVEGIHADSFREDLPVQASDENRWDVQNAFVDLELFETDTGGTHTLRTGRQELLFGRQRLISPLDWANTRRNFEGFDYIVKEKDYKLDIFAVNPVNSATGFNSVTEFNNKFDEANRDVFLSGAYFSYSGIENSHIDLYYLWLEDDSPIPARADGSRHTVGTRYSKLLPQEGGRVWDLDVEGGFQFGNDNGQDVRAGFATGVLGHTWKQAAWSPRVSGLFYYGSGDNRSTDHQNNTFDTLFPLGHAYWGISDNLSGQNLVDYSLQLDVKPSGPTGVIAAYHVFNLASDQDRAYNVAGSPVGAPGNGTDLGQSLDLYGHYTFSPSFDIQAGYSWFWYGEFIERTTPRDDANQFYIQTSIRY